MAGWVICSVGAENSDQASDCARAHFVSGCFNGELADRANARVAKMAWWVMASDKNPLKVRRWWNDYGQHPRGIAAVASFACCTGSATDDFLMESLLAE